jgi:tripartite-type tricarboxylate transporter receptor subunit TctC
MQRARLARILRLGSLALLTLLSAAAQAQGSGAAIRLVVPFGAGTSTDNVGRVLAEALGRRLKQPMVVENRAGAGGGIGSGQVAKAPADGRTLLLGTVGTHAINAALYRRLPYDPQKDFVPLGFVGFTPLLAVVPADSPARSVPDLAALARRPQGLFFASAGNGTSGHLAGDLLASHLGGKMVHVPYKDGAQAVSDLIAGTVDLMFYHPTAVMPHVLSGRLRALGVSSAQRSAAAPAVPTMAEQGLADFELLAWFMLYAHSATPVPLIDQLRQAVAAVLAEPEVQARLNAQGVELRPMRAEQLLAFSRAEIGKWAQLVARSGAQVD